MFLTTEAALEACESAVDHDLLIGMIEGGIFCNPGVEMRLDCIWHGFNPPLGKRNTIRNNRLAAQFIREESNVHDTFVLTAQPRLSKELD